MSGNYLMPNFNPESYQTVMKYFIFDRVRDYYTNDLDVYGDLIYKMY